MSNQRESEQQSSSSKHGKGKKSQIRLQFVWKLVVIRMESS